MLKELRDTETKKRFLKQLAVSASATEELYENVFSHLDDLPKGLKKRIKALEQGLQNILETGIPEVYLSAGDYLKHGKSFEKDRTQILTAYMQRKNHGYTYSYRIWKCARNTSRYIQRIIKAGLAEGLDAGKLTTAIDSYVHEGVKTIAKNYPNMLARMGGRVPGQVNYEALRLVRTEYSYAFAEGTKTGARLNPYVIGLGVRMANTHPESDICDTLSTQDKYGLGPGNYPVEKAPEIPAHPNCLCTLIPLVGDV
jgi:hypothetical protein